MHVEGKTLQLWGNIVCYYTTTTTQYSLGTLSQWIESEFSLCGFFFMITVASNCRTEHSCMMEIGNLCGGGWDIDAIYCKLPYIPLFYVYFTKKKWYEVIYSCILYKSFIYHHMCHIKYKRARMYKLTFSSTVKLLILKKSLRVICQYI